VARRQLDALRRHQVEERVVRRRHRLVHRGDHALVLLRPGDGEDARMRRADLLGLRAHAAGDDDAAVLGQRLADRAERLGLRRIEEAAGVHHHHVGAGVVLGDLVALGAQLRQDAFRIDERLRAAEADERDLRREIGCRRVGGGRGLDFTHDAALDGATRPRPQ